MTDPGKRRAGRLVAGFVIIALGVLFTLDNMGIANAHQVLRWWPALLVLFGLQGLFGYGCRRAPVFGTLAIVVGSWLLLNEAGIVHRDIMQLWPVVLIVLGIAMIRGRSLVWRVGVVRPEREAADRIREAWHRRSDRGVGAASSDPAGANVAPAGEPNSRSAGGAAASADDSAAGTFSLDALMSNVARKITLQNLTRGAVVALMGGADVDLRSARMATGIAALEVNLVMGGLNLFVPEDWTVEFEGTPVMGNVDDQSRHPLGVPRGRLRIAGTVLMSSIVIRN